MATRRHDEQIGSETTTLRTGRTREQWHELLDAAGAARWPHKRIAEWLVAEHDVDGWWAQSLTVGYEQARGMRLPGQRPDGTFEANASKTVARGADDVFTHLLDDARRAAWAGPGWRVASATAPKRARLEHDDGSRVHVEVTTVSAGKVRVSVQHVRLPDPDAVARWKAHWQEALGLLADATG